jgi:alpha-D-ribose 1-methylphosphonate 5-triphosphate synthase subunit PhnH
MTALASNAAFASQSVFRTAMECFARPGEIRSLAGVAAPAPLAPATAALVQSLADYETPIWLDQPLTSTSAVSEWISFQTGAPLANDPRQAAFALIADPLALQDFVQFALGNEEYPDRSTTLILQIERFDGRKFTVEGPGIQGARAFAAKPLPENFVERLTANRETFPCGVDLLLVAGEQVMALPRSVRISSGA